MENKGKKNREEKKNRVKEKPVCLFYLPLEREQKEERRQGNQTTWNGEESSGRILKEGFM